MKALIVNQAEVIDLLPMAECMDVMADALKTLARDVVGATNILRLGKQSSLSFSTYANAYQVSKTCDTPQRNNPRGF